MSKRRWLRPRQRISYFEPEEPDLDEYIFCEKCGDYVYEYCSIHGPLLVIPDDKVPSKHNFPPCVPRAALTIPKVFLHLNYSTIPGAGLGVFTTLTLPQGVRFGPYRGVSTKQVTSDYCWQIYGRDRKPSHVVDASDGDKSNWMRFVNCARHWREQNLVAFQYQGQLYYRTIRIIPRFTELMVFYGSEFAKNLHINLGKYNAPKSYAQKFGAQPNKPKVIEIQKAKEETKTPAKEKEIKSTVTEPVIPKFPAKKRPKENPSETHKEVPAAKKRKTAKPRTKVTIREEITEVKPSENKTRKQKNDESVKKTETKSLTANSKDLSSDDNTDRNINHKPQNAVQNNTDTNCTASVDNAVITNDTEKENVPVIVEPDNVTSIDDNGKENLPANKKQFIVTSNDQIGKPNADKNTLKKLDDINRKERRIIVKDTQDLYFSCNVCNYQDVTKESLEKHMRFHDVNRKYVCKTCGYRFNISACLNNHIKTHKTNDVEIFDRNVNDVTTKQSLENDLKTSKGEKQPSDTFNKKSTQKGVKNTNSQDVYFTCNVCKYRGVTKQSLEKHMRLHDMNRKFVCETCGYRFNQNAHLKDHIRIHETNDVELLDRNVNDVTTKQSLENDPKTPRGEKQPNDTFNKKITQKGLTNTNLTMHSRDKSFTCHVCNYKSNRAGSLKRHMNVHSEIKPYTCNVCNKSFKTKDELKQHLMIHSELKPYECDKCDYRASQVGHLKIHLRVHTGEKPYECDICDYRTSDVSNLKIHLLVHTGEKPYKCDICDHRSSRASDLKIHVQVHSDEKAYSCDICDYKCIRKGQLNNHLKRKHLS